MKVFAPWISTVAMNFWKVGYLPNGKKKGGWGNQMYWVCGRVLSLRRWWEGSLLCCGLRRCVISETAPYLGGVCFQHPFAVRFKEPLRTILREENSLPLGSHFVTAFDKELGWTHLVSAGVCTYRSCVFLVCWAGALEHFTMPNSSRTDIFCK